MAVVKISKCTVDAALKAGVTAYAWDAELKGFGIRISAPGQRDPEARATYLVQYRMKGAGSPTQRYKIGRHGSPWTPERARERASDLLEMVRLGIDPIAKQKADAEAAIREERTASRVGFSIYAEAYLVRRVDDQKRGKEVRSIFDRDLKPHFLDRPITKITKADIGELLDKVSERNASAANKAHKALKTFFTWAVGRDTITASPMIALPVPNEKADQPRDHVLTDEELRLVWAAAPALAAPFGDMLRLLIVTGQRLREVAGMTLSEFDLATGTWTIPKERTKNGVTHLVPLSPLAVSILKGITPTKSAAGFVFTTTGKSPISGFSKAKRKLDEKIAAIATKEAEGGEAPARLPAPWRFHDLRRTLATGCERLGIPIAVTEAVLNHVSGSKRGIVKVYQRHTYAAEKRAALEQWALEVSRITGAPLPHDEAASDEAGAAVIDLEADRAARA